ncbi:MAG: GTPase Era [Acidimicrobiales bacterium]
MTAFRSGFATVTGRPNVGKSTLVNAMVGEKVTVVSKQPNTTRTTLRGVVHLPDAQLVLIDTPGVHKPKTALGGRMNEAASGSLADVDVVVAVLDATAAVGPGDRIVLERSLSVLRPPSESALARSGQLDTPGAALMVVVNKVDRAGRDDVLRRLTEAARVIDGLEAAAGAAAEAAAGTDERLVVEYFPVSALTGEGVASLVEAIVKRLPEGPEYYPAGMVRELSEASWVADLVREELLRHVEDELPHSIACRVTEWEWPRVRCEIVVERDSQKGIVIGKGGQRLKEVGTAVRHQLPEGAYLELFVRVEKRWQQREDALDRLGL